MIQNKIKIINKKRENQIKWILKNSFQEIFDEYKGPSLRDSEFMQHGGGVYEMYCPACSGPYSDPFSEDMANATEEDYREQAKTRGELEIFNKDNKSLFSWLNDIVAFT